MKKICLFSLVFIITVIVYGQNTVTNNNTITINGNVYYFRPSTTPSSPPPRQISDFLGSGSWYGADAARAWASIADWVVDHCLSTTAAIRADNFSRVYISAVHVIRSGDSNFNNLAAPRNISYSLRQVRIDYWRVRNNERMEDGSRETRWFLF